eukprot:1060312-Amphidinium_carterae.1
MAWARMNRWKEPSEVLWNLAPNCTRRGRQPFKRPRSGQNESFCVREVKVFSSGFSGGQSKFA